MLGVDGCGPFAGLAIGVLLGVDQPIALDPQLAQRHVAQIGKRQRHRGGQHGMQLAQQLALGERLQSSCERHVMEDGLHRRAIEAGATVQRRDRFSGSAADGAEPGVAFDARVERPCRMVSQVNAVQRSAGLPGGRCDVQNRRRFGHVPGRGRLRLRPATAARSARATPISHAQSLPARRPPQRARDPQTSPARPADACPRGNCWPRRTNRPVPSHPSLPRRPPGSVPGTSRA